MKLVILDKQKITFWVTY